MTLTEYRETRGLTLERCALELDLSAGSKGHLSRLETGQAPWPLRLALQVEAWSAGAVTAVELLDPEDAALLAGAIERATVGADA